MAHLAAGLDGGRFTPVVCSLTPEPSPLAGQLRDAGVPVHTLECRDGLDARAVLQLGRLMRTTRADVIHCYNPRPILYGGVAAKALRIRATIGSLSAFACQVPDRTYAFLPEPLRTSSRRNVYRNRVAGRLMRFVVTVSEGLGRRFCEFNSLPLDKLRVVPYGADVAAVEHVDAAEAAALRARLGYGDGDVVVGSVGRLVEQKDYPTQLEAFARAAAGEPSLKMVLAGDGPLAGEIRARIESLGLAGRVRMLGHWDNVPLLLKAIDVFVLASKFEPFGVALLEAKAAALPIVATRVNEIPEIVGDEESGLLAPPEDPAALGVLIARLGRDPALRARLGGRALAEARERHSLQASIRAYHDLYDAALN
jgi:glycosyltransferase involved in cell wall biosynthesis